MRQTHDDGRRRRGPGARAARRLGALATACILLLAGCDDESLMPPEPPEGGEIFQRYVALGNSLTAGFQSSGINDSTQRQSYAALLARKMGTDFDLPLLRRPGCPPPLVNVFTGTRVAGGSSTDCALRSTPIPENVHNLAVPGAEVIDALMNVGPETNANALTQFILGGRTQIEAAADVRPSFASVWLGNNDVLGAALAGNPALTTSPSDFRSRYTAVLDALEGAAAEDGLDAILVGVANVTVIPHLSPGAAYLQAEQQDEMLPEDQESFPENFQVDSNCDPSASGATLVPFTYGFGVMISVAAQLEARSPSPPTISLDCTDNRPVEDVIEDQTGQTGLVPDPFRGISILLESEAVEIATRVAEFNAFIQSQASDRGFAFFDPNPTLVSLRATGQIPLFPNAADDPTTEVVEPEAVPFGPFFSRDGVHPSAATHRMVADSLAAAINEQYGTSLPVGDGGT